MRLADRIIKYIYNIIEKFTWSTRGIYIRGGELCYTNTFGLGAMKFGVSQSLG